MNIVQCQINIFSNLHSLTKGVFSDLDLLMKLVYFDGPDDTGFRSLANEVNRIRKIGIMFYNLNPIWLRTHQQLLFLLGSDRLPYFIHSLSLDLKIWIYNNKSIILEHSTKYEEIEIATSSLMDNLHVYSKRRGLDAFFALGSSRLSNSKGSIYPQQGTIGIDFTGRECFLRDHEGYLGHFFKDVCDLIIISINFREELYRRIVNKLKFIGNRDELVRASWHKLRVFYSQDQQAYQGLGEQIFWILKNEILEESLFDTHKAYHRLKYHARRMNNLFSRKNLRNLSTLNKE